MPVKVRWYREAWWIFARSPRIPGSEGRLARKIGLDRDEAERRAEALRRQLGEADASKMLTVGPMCLDWIDAYASTLKPTTAATFRGLIDREIVKFIGTLDFQTFREIDLLRYIDARLAAGLGVATIRNALKIVRRVGNLAVRDGLIARNPAAEIGRLLRRVEIAQATESRRAEAWTQRELAAVLATTREFAPKQLSAIALLAYTGMRKGEALGLRWNDVDLERRVLHVRRSISMGFTTTPKSGRGRLIPIAPELAAILAPLRIGAKLDGPVLSGRRRATPLADVVLRRAWKRVQERLRDRRVRVLTLHGFRHTWATLALQAGRPVRWVAEILGHADPAFTLRVYAHVLQDARGDLDFLGCADPQISATDAEVSTKGIPNSPNNSAGMGGDPGQARTDDLELRRLAL